MSDNKRQEDTSLLVAQLAGVLAVAFVFAPMLQGLTLAGLVLSVGVGFGLILHWANTCQGARPKPAVTPTVEAESDTAVETVTPAEAAASPTNETAGPAEPILGLAEATLDLAEPTESPVEPVASPAPAARIALAGPERFPRLVEGLRGWGSPQFEKIVEMTCRNLGYSVSRPGTQAGIDLVVENESGSSALQCRHWQAADVPAAAVREFAEALARARLSRGVLVALGLCTAEARREASRSGIEILDGTGLDSLLRAADAEHSPQIQALLAEARKLCPGGAPELVPCAVAEGASQAA